MSLLDQLNQEMIAAMKAHETQKLGVLRYLLSQIKYVQIDQGTLDDAQVQKIIAKEIKQGEEAMAQFTQGNRQDLVDEEKQKLEILKSYLPQAMSESEVQVVIDKVLSQDPQPDFGSAMKQVMTQVGTRSSGQVVSGLLKKALGK